MKEGIKRRVSEELPRLLLCFFPPVLMECFFQFLVLKNGMGTLPMLCYALLVGSIIWLVTGWCSSRAGKILYSLVSSILGVYFIVQIVYYHVFSVFFSFASLFAVGGDILEFKSQIWNAVMANVGKILAYFLLLAVSIGLFVRFVRVQKHSWRFHVPAVTLAAVLLVVFQASLLVGRTDYPSAYDLYKKDWTPVLGVKKLGLFVLAQKDMVSLVTGGNFKNDLDDLIIVDRVTVTPVISSTPTVASNQAVSVLSPTITPTPTPTPIDTSPNILDFDFSALAEAESNKEIKKLHEYFATEEYTLKNEYTGMFEGYNLIFITAEGFAPYAMVDGLTPTLQKLTSEGFVFEHYYSPLWFTSTIDGEFANMTGLLPDQTYSFRRMIGHDMRFSLSMMLQKLGYLTNAYHNHSYTYYDRNKIYPNMGYTYKGRGNGLNVTKQWPGSDLEMMELSVSEYIGEEPFHVYYMTVSGHLEYSFTGNSMSAKHRDVVKDLPYSDTAKAYIACNYELELALTYLLEQLEEAGIADRTVIVLAADHYPYGLENSVISELLGHEAEEKFELYESTLILWSGSMEQPVVVDKYCSSIDIVPTLANLFGLDYDSRLYMGKDILSDSEGLVMFSDKSFITDKVMYNASNGKVTALTEEELPETYVETMIQIVKNRFKVSKGIIDRDYYSYLPELEEISE